MKPFLHPAVRKLFLAFSFLCYCLLIIEMISQFYFVVLLKRSPFENKAGILSFYPELESLQVTPNQAPDYKILLLGGSVLYSWPNSSVTKELLGKIKINGRKIRFYNAAFPSHSSLDSSYKFEFLKNQPYDLIIFYQAINETRTNNIPTRYFRNDYSHYSWYSEVNFYHRFKFLSDAGLKTPLFFFRLYVALAQLLRIEEFIPEHWPKTKYLKYGAKIKSAFPFKENVSRILQSAREKNIPVILSTFAFFKPPGYDKNLFRRKQPDPSLGPVYRDFYKLPFELWGTPENVIKGLKAHNEIIRSFQDHPAVIQIIPMDEVMPKNEEYFEDVCHFTPKGYHEFLIQMFIPFINIPLSEKDPEFTHFSIEKKKTIL